MPSTTVLDQPPTCSASSVIAPPQASVSSRATRSSWRGATQRSPKSRSEAAERLLTAESRLDIAAASTAATSSPRRPTGSCCSM